MGVQAPIKSEILKFRVTVEEQYEIDDKCYELKMNRSDYLRMMCFEKEVILFDFSELDKLTSEVGRIGVNINQIARKLNMGGQLSKDNGIFLKSAMEVIDATMKKIYADIGKMYVRKSG